MRPREGQPAPATAHRTRGMPARRRTARARRSENGTGRADKFLTTALRLFAERDYAAVTM